MELLNKIFNAGVVGAGGAGFPTHTKLNCKVEYLLINAAECEPLLYTDKYIMSNFPKEIVKSVLEVKGMVEAREAYIAVKKVNDKEIAALQGAINELNAPVKVFPLENYYPAGDEQMLVYDITKRTVPPAGIPLNVGCVVSNVSTILNIYDAMSDIPVTHKYLTVTGEVGKPSVLKVPIGISFKECIESCGGSKLNTYKIISGGPMMGKVFDSSEIDSLFVTKTTSGIIIVKDSDNFVARLTGLSVDQILSRAKSACIQCSFCTEMCPRNLIGHSIRPNRIMRHMASLDFDKKLNIDDEILKESLICSECGVCETYACPMGLSPRQVNKYVKSQLAGGKRYSTNAKEFTASRLREYKKIVPSKIMMRMGLGNLYSYKVNSFAELNTYNVKIPLRQHIGMPATPCVSVGDFVNCGQIIGTGQFDKVSANIHASISGKVASIADSVEIKGGVS